MLDSLRSHRFDVDRLDGTQLRGSFSTLYISSVVLSTYLSVLKFFSLIDLSVCTLAELGGPFSAQQVQRDVEREFLTWCCVGLRRLIVQQNDDRMFKSFCESGIREQLTGQRLNVNKAQPRY